MKTNGTARLAEVRKLVERARTGDDDAFGTLVRHYERPVHAVVVSCLGDNPDTPDIVQDYNIAFSMQGQNYSEWIPEDGNTVVVDFKVGDGNGDEVSATSFTFFQVEVTSHPGKYTNDDPVSGDDFDPPVFNPNQVVLTPRDFGGSIVIPHLRYAFEILDDLLPDSAEREK